MPGGRFGRIRLCGLVVVAVASMWSAGAKAAPPAVPMPFELEASNGYSVLIWGIPAWKGSAAKVLLVASSRSAKALYVAPATVTDGSIQTSLGGLGVIDVIWRPSGRRKKTRSACGEKPVSFDPGTYEGRIEFNGELGYTELHATQAAGNVSFLLDLICPGTHGPRGRGPGAPGAVLSVRSKARPGIGLVAHKNRPGDPAFFSASVAERKGALAIERSVSIRARPSTFDYVSRLRRATVRPPTPFSGRAVFHRNATPANRWTGTLAVDFPGRDDVDLTPPGVRAGLFHGEWDNSAR